MRLASRILGTTRPLGCRLAPRRFVGTRSTSTASSATSQSGAKSIVYLAAGLVVGVAVGSPLFGFSSDATPSRWTNTESRKHSPRRKYADKTTMLKAVDELRQLLGEELVSVDHDDLEEHGHSYWSSTNTDARPVAIVRPQSTEQVSAIARVCTKYKVPMVPYGAGSSVEGNFSSPFSGICIDLSTMDKILAFHPDDLDVVVQPGVNWGNLNNTIKDSGLWLPPDPSPTALIGGMVSTNCSGTNAMRYGQMKDYVVNLTVVLADGSVIKTRNRPRKTSAGYNLNGIFSGSEGTLGIITEITLKLATVPASQSVATVTFESIRHAASAASTMIKSGIPVAALELMDEVQMNIINKNGGAGGRMWRELPTLFIKFSGTETSIKDNIKSVKQVAKSHGCKSFEFADTKQQMEALWSARKEVFWAYLAIRPEGTEIWSTDVAVPISRLAELIEKSKQRTAQRGLFSSIIGHVGDGNFHQMIMYRPGSPEEKQAVLDCVNLMVEDAIAMDGTVTGEHGVGIGKKQSLAKELDGPTLGVMKALKDTLDPHWLLNPGKVFDE